MNTNLFHDPVFDWKEFSAYDQEDEDEEEHSGGGEGFGGDLSEAPV